MDWTGCSAVEQKPDGCSVVRSTHVLADHILDAFEAGESALEIAWKDRLEPAAIQAVLAFAFRDDQLGGSTRVAKAVPVPGVNWIGCEYVEVIEGKVSGAPLLRNTRMPADAIWECAVSGYSVLEIAGDYSLLPSEVEGVLAWALAHTGLKKAS